MNCRDLECRLEALAAGSLPAAEERAHAEHLAGCAACRELVELARLAEVPPDPGFTADVLRITLPFDVQIRRWWDALWPQLWHRPRFASEAAYVGLVVLVLAFATPGSPLAAVPAGALAIAQEPQLPRLELPAVAVAPAEAAAGGGNVARAPADDTVQLIIEVRTRMGTFWDEAASLLETRDDAPSSTPEPVKETS
jgi:hypothetical protein